MNNREEKGSKIEPYIFIIDLDTYIVLTIDIILDIIKDILICIQLLKKQI